MSKILSVGTTTPPVFDMHSRKIILNETARYLNWVILDKEKYLAGKQDIASKDEELAEQEKGLAEKIKRLQESRYERKEAEREQPAVSESDLEKGLTRDLLRCLVQKAVVKSDGEVEIYWNFMDEVNG